MKLGLGLLHALQLRSCKHQAHNRQLTRPQSQVARASRCRTVGHPLTFARKSRQHSHNKACSVASRTGAGLSWLGLHCCGPPTPGWRTSKVARSELLRGSGVQCREHGLKRSCYHTNAGLERTSQRPGSRTPGHRVPYARSGVPPAVRAAVATSQAPNLGLVRAPLEAPPDCKRLPGASPL